MKYYLYNPKANNGIEMNIAGVEFVDATKIDYPKFFEELKPEDEVVLVGGDGTINYFINAVDPKTVKNNVYVYGGGSGNDFLNDINENHFKEVLLNPYINNLPVVEVKGMKKRYINNMGLGFDGYVCEVADEIKLKKPQKKINYTTIAIRCILFGFKPFSAKVDVDGEVSEYDNVWLVPTMKGRCYGGGMMMAPNQDRNSDILTTVVVSCKSKLKILMLFPSIFKGEHLKNTDVVKVFTGKKVHVKLSNPTSSQIDGETVLAVDEYWVSI